MNNKILNVLVKESKQMAIRIIRDKTSKLISDNKYRNCVKNDILSKFSRNLKLMGHEDKFKIKYVRIIRWLIKTFNIEDVYMLDRFKSIPYKCYTFKYNGSVLYIDHSKEGDNILLDIKIITIKKEIGDNIYKELVDISAGSLECISDSSNNFIAMYKCDGEDICDRMLVPKRSLDTIFSNELPLIISDLENFMSKKSIFKKHQLPFKTGIFLYGEPGTGKSSIVKAIASNFNMDIFYINLTELNYGQLKNTVNDINGRTRRIRTSIILLEEIDLSENEDNSFNEKNKKLSLLLNWLDGQESPSDIIFIATTNYIDKVDERIKRSGRFDYKYEISQLDEDQASKMCMSFDINPKEILELDEFKDCVTYSPAKVQEYILKKIVVGINE